jgi:hypothetical protein
MSTPATTKRSLSCAETIRQKARETPGSQPRRLKNKLSLRLES